MNSTLLDDILQDIKDDSNFPHGGDKETRVNYLKFKQVFNPHIKEAIKEYLEHLEDVSYREDDDNGLKGMFDSLAEPDGSNLNCGNYYLSDGVYLTPEGDIVSEDDM